MNFAVESVLASGPQTVGIWLLLLVLAAASLIALADRGGRSGPARIAAGIVAQSRQRHQDRARRAAQTADMARYAEEVTIAAHRATIAVQRSRGQWHDAQQRLAAAGDARQNADAQVLQACRAAAYRSPATELTPADYADRERHLHAAAALAHRQGRLSTGQLRDALAHRNGWDPRLHPADQDVVVSRAARSHLHHLYQQAITAERAAWNRAGMAVTAARTLRAEADTAISTACASRTSPRRHKAVLNGLSPATNALVYKQFAAQLLV